MVDDTQDASARSGSGRMRAIVFIPLVLFLALAGVFLYEMWKGGDTSDVPSALIGSPAPNFDLPAIEGLAANGAPVPGLARADLLGQVTVVNVWASWCVPCRAEHPILAELATDSRFRVVGINYKDQPENARRFLGQLGNPFARIGADTTGRSAIDWGVYGVPETFLIGRDGTILYKVIGPLSPQKVETDLLPEIEKALAG